MVPGVVAEEEPVEMVVRRLTGEMEYHGSPPEIFMVAEEEAAFEMPVFQKAHLDMEGLAEEDEEDAILMIQRQAFQTQEAVEVEQALAKLV
jgi:hypothetical protein